jgi:hypothetical protein
MRGIKRAAQRARARRDSEALAELRRLRADVQALAGQISGPLSGQLTDLTRRQEEAEHAQRPLRFRGVWLLALFLTFALAAAHELIGASGALRDPLAPLRDNAGNFAIAVQAPTPTNNLITVDDLATSGIGISATFWSGKSKGTSTSTAQATYLISFPLQLGGERFALLLSDGAVFASHTKVPGEHGNDPPLSCPDHVKTAVVSPYNPQVCQVISGVVPNYALDPYRPRHGEPCPWQTAADYRRPTARVEISGKLLISPLVWTDHEHQGLAYPQSTIASSADDLIYADTLNSWHGQSLGRRFAVTDPPVCKQVMVPGGTRPSDSQPLHYTQADGMLRWEDGEAAEETSVVFTNRDAEAVANEQLALGGVLAGLAAGFLPTLGVTVVSSARRWRQRRRRRSASNS